MTDRVLLMNAKGMQFRSVPVKRDEQCSLCGVAPSLTSVSPGTTRPDREPGRMAHPFMTGHQMALNQEQLERYARQLVMPEFPVPSRKAPVVTCFNLRQGFFGEPLHALSGRGRRGTSSHFIPRSGDGQARQEDRCAQQRRDGDPEGARPNTRHGPGFHTGCRSLGGQAAAGALGSGFPFIMSLRARGAALLRRFQPGDPCPGCVLNAAGFGVSELIPDTDNGMAGPAAAAMAIGELAGYLRPSRKTTLLDPVSGHFDDVEAAPVEGCVLCGLLSSRT